MAKKKGKGKKKKAKKEKEPPVPRSFYENQIIDLNRQLAELRSSTFVLEGKNLELVKNYEQIEVDRDDVIFYIKYQLQLKIDEIAQMKVSLAEIEEAKEKDQEKFEEEIQAMNEEFQAMQEQLTGEIKQIQGRINSLEEYRLEKDELLRKFEIQEQVMEEQEIRHKKVLYDTEIKFILEKDAFSKEMRKKVKELDMDFSEANDLRIAATTQSAIFESLTANKTINKQITINEQLEKENLDLKTRVDDLKRKHKLLKAQRNVAQNKALKEKQLINHLTTEHEKLTEKLAEHDILIKQGYKDEVDLQDTNERVNKIETKLIILNQNIHKTRSSQVFLTAKVQEIHNGVSILNEILNDTIIFRKYLDHLQSLDLKNTQKLLQRDELFQSLLNVIAEALCLKEPKEPTGARKSKRSIARSLKYTRGDLGIIPKFHEDKTVPNIFYAISQVGKSLESLLEVRSQSTYSTESIFVEAEEMSEETISLEEESTESKKFSAVGYSDDDIDVGDERKVSAEVIDVAEIPEAKEIYGEGYEAMAHHLKLLEEIGEVTYEWEASPQDNDSEI